MSDELPQGWVELLLGDDSDFKKGKKPNNLYDQNQEKLLPYIDIKAFEKGIYRRYASVNDGVVAQDNDCLMVWDGARSGLVGRSVAGIIGSTLMRIKPRASSPAYFYYFLRSQFQFINGNTKGTGIPHVDPAKLWSIQYQLPPLNEQIRIANKLDSLLAKVDTAQTRLEKIPTLLKRFRQSVLAAATSGELTREWREGLQTKGNPVIEVQKYKKEWINDNESHNETTRVKKRLKAFSAKTVSSENLPENWHWCKLEDCVLMIVDCHNKTAPYVDSGIPLIRTSNVRDGRFVWKGLRYVDKDTYAYWSKRCPPSSGDIIFTREAPMGEATIIPEKTKVCLGQRTMLIRPVEDSVSAKYLLLAITEPEFKKRSDQFAVGTGVKHYRVGDVSNLLVPIPSTEEQTEIVRRVESLFTLADSVEKQYTEAKKCTDRLTQSLLAKAFRGKLVPQDSNDEPASELLKRIQSEREQLALNKPKRKVEAGKANANATANGAIRKRKPKKNMTMNLNEAPEKYLLDLLTQLGGEADAKVLWNKTELEIDDFYAKLKREMSAGNIVDDKASSDPSQRKLKLATID